ncbi:hypothetical protein GCM10023116_15080 [Kistimonas scapharcae]|uniref:Uncharacterized protein n=1 Tax=Kistimonas scapharcae TaxID=1036133 RepID=A0ABP8V0W7_9GAMM
MMDEYEYLQSSLKFLEDTHHNLTKVIESMELSDCSGCHTSAMALKYQRDRVEEEIKRLQDRLQALEQ